MFALAICASAFGVDARAQSSPVAQLSSSALDLSIEAHREAPDSGTVIYAGAALPHAVLRDVRVRIDDQPAILYQFNEDEARALNAGGLKRLSVLSSETAGGSHRLRAEFRAREDTGKPQATGIIAQVDRTFDATGGGVAVVINAGSFVSSASLEIQPVGGDAAVREADVLLAGGRPFEAAVLYRAAPAVDPAKLNAALAALGLQDADTRSSPLLAQYNSAIARGGDASIAGLQLLGDGKAISAEGLAARDLASVALGYRELQAGQHDAAAEAFRQVRSPGPYSNAAMLGLGWSYLVPSGDKPATADIPLRPIGDDAIAAARRQTPFRYLQAVANGNRTEDLRRALIPWSELLGRDPLDASVQEGMVVIPYALDHLGAHQQAKGFYERAVNTLTAARASLNQAQHELADGSVLADVDARDAGTDSGWPRLLVERKDDALAVPVRKLIDAPPVAARLHDYRQLQAIDGALALDAARLGDRDPGLAARIATQRQQLAAARGPAAAAARGAMSDELQRLDKQTSEYLAEAEFALARVYDRDEHGAGP